jgi:hypothetical protein
MFGHIVIWRGRETATQRGNARIRAKFVVFLIERDKRDWGELFGLWLHTLAPLIWLAVMFFAAWLLSSNGPHHH